jgi:hypothetical protein
MDHSTYVRDIATLRLSNAHCAGGKGANLGELAATGLGSAARHLISCERSADALGPAPEVSSDRCL